MVDNNLGSPSIDKGKGKVIEQEDLRETVVDGDRSRQHEGLQETIVDARWIEHEDLHETFVDARRNSAIAEYNNHMTVNGDLRNRRLRNNVCVETLMLCILAYRQLMWMRSSCAEDYKESTASTRKFRSDGASCSKEALEDQSSPGTSSDRRLPAPAGNARAAGIGNPAALCVHDAVHAQVEMDSMNPAAPCVDNCSCAEPTTMSNLPAPCMHSSVYAAAAGIDMNAAPGVDNYVYTQPAIEIPAVCVYKSAYPQAAVESNPAPCVDSSGYVDGATDHLAPCADDPVYPQPAARKRRAVRDSVHAQVVDPLQSTTEEVDAEVAGPMAAFQWRLLFDMSRPSDNRHPVRSQNVEHQRPVPELNLNQGGALRPHLHGHHEHHARAQPGCRALLDRAPHMPDFRLDAALPLMPPMADLEAQYTHQMQHTSFSLQALLAHERYQVRRHLFHQCIELEAERAVANAQQYLYSLMQPAILTFEQVTGAIEEFIAGEVAASAARYLPPLLHPAAPNLHRNRYLQAVENMTHCAVVIALALNYSQHYMLRQPTHGPAPQDMFPAPPAPNFPWLQAVIRGAAGRNLQQAPYYQHQPRPHLQQLLDLLFRAGNPLWMSARDAASTSRAPPLYHHQPPPHSTPAPNSQVPHYAPPAILRDHHHGQPLQQDRYPRVRDIPNQMPCFYNTNHNNMMQRSTHLARGPYHPPHHHHHHHDEATASNYDSNYPPYQPSASKSWQKRRAAKTKCGSNPPHQQHQPPPPPPPPEKKLVWRTIKKDPPCID